MDQVKLTKAFRQVAETAAGKTVLRYLMAESGFLTQNITTAINSGEINTQALVYNEARRVFYIQAIRRWLTEKQLVSIEIDREDELDAKE